MISILAVLFVLSPNADTGRIQQLTARLDTHEQRLHPALKESIRTQVLPNLSSYDALYRRIAEQLQTREDLYPLLGSLDILRRADISTWTDDTAPSSRWIYLKWNRLLTLSLRLERLDSILETSSQTISTLKDEANQYLLASHTTGLSVFMATYERRRPQLSATRVALSDLVDDLKNVIFDVRQVQSAVAPFGNSLFIGPVAKHVVTLSKQLRISLKALQSTFVSSSNTLDRDIKLIDNMRKYWLSARAHDAYDGADRLATAGRLGSALRTFIGIRNDYPETAWAHRADLRVSELTADLDSRPSRKDCVDLKTSHRYPTVSEQSANETEGVFWKALSLILLLGCLGIIHRNQST